MLSELLDEVEKEVSRSFKLLLKFPRKQRLRIVLLWMGLTRLREMNDHLESNVIHKGGVEDATIKTNDDRF